jgi:hypothetical protein
MMRSAAARLAARMASVDLTGLSFSFRYVLNVSPIAFLSSLFIVLIVWFAYLVRIGEMPADPETHIYFWNDLWLLIVTVSTVGYGDITPKTHFGRFAASMALVLGVINTSLIISVLSTRVSLRPSEMRLIDLVQRDSWRKALQRQAVRCIQVWFRTMLVRRRAATGDRGAAREVLAMERALKKNYDGWVRTRRMHTALKNRDPQLYLLVIDMAHSIQVGHSRIF